MSSAELSRLALNTATLGHNLDGYGAGWSAEQTVDALVERGYAGVTFWTRELQDRAVAIGNYCRAQNLEVAGLCRTPFLVGPMAERDLGRLMDQARYTVDQAAALDTRVLTIVTGGVEPGSKGLAYTQKVLAERVGELADYAAQCSVKLALEPLHPMYAGNRNCLTSIEEAWSVCLETGHGNVGIAADVYHLWWDERFACSLKQVPADRILGVHLCDWLADTTDMLLDRGMMGDGVADVRAFRQAADDAGYQGLYEVEIFSKDNWWLKPPEEVLDTVKSRYLEEC